MRSESAWSLVALHLGVARDRGRAVVLVVVVLQRALARLVADAAVDRVVQREELQHLLAARPHPRRIGAARACPRRPACCRRCRSSRGAPSPSTSTMQMRQLPATDSCGCQQKYGISRPLARAACITVWPSSASTGCPLMKISHGTRGRALRGGRRTASGRARCSTRTRRGTWRGCRRWRSRRRRPCRRSWCRRWPCEIAYSRSMSSGPPSPATMRSMMRCSQPMPSRHGVHWPHDSWW